MTESERILAEYRDQIRRLCGEERAKKSLIEYDRGWYYIELARKFPDGSIGIISDIKGASAYRKTQVLLMIKNLKKRQPDFTVLKAELDKSFESGTLVPHKIYQTRFGKKDDCLRACLATMLMLKIEDIPELSDIDTWVVELNKWLVTKEIYAVVYWAKWKPPKEAFVIACGKSPREISHCVIMKNGEVVHDPHPECGGLVGKIEDYLLLVPLKPWSFEMLMGVYAAGVSRQLADSRKKKCFHKHK